MQPAELLNKAKIHIEGAHFVRQLMSNDTEVFVQSISQRDAALNMAQLKEFCVVKQDYPVEILGVPLGTITQGGKRHQKWQRDFLNQFGDKSSDSRNLD